MKLSPFFCAALALGTGLTLYASTASAITTYDGTYSVEAITDEGPCTSAQTGTVTVVDGLISASSETDVKAFGRIGGDGAVSFALHRGPDVAHVSGRINGARAKGAWSAPLQLCGGHWTGQKIK